MKVFILRHGEAGTAATDRERELTPKGIEQALQAGLLLEHEGAQTLLYSPKARTRQTAEQVASLCAQLPCQESLSLLPPATVDDITAVLEELEEAGTTAVILVSHIPLVAQLAGWLMNGDTSAYTLPGYPPASIVALEMEQVGPGAGNLLWYALSPDFEKRRH
jgi:phosphohistidine phosphatase